MTSNYSEKFIVMGVLIFVLFSFLISESFAENIQSKENLEILSDIDGISESEKYNIGIMLENVGKIDRHSGSYDLIF